MPVTISAPGPGFHDCLKNLWAFRKQPIPTMRRWKQAHGDLVKLWLGNRKFYVGFHPDFAQHILRDRYSNFPKSRLIFKMIQPITGVDGLVQLEGKEWEKVRRPTTPLFWGKEIERHVPVIDESARALFPEWDRLAANQEKFDVCPGITDMVLRASGRILFTADFANEASELGEKFVEMNRICGQRIRSVVYLPGFIPSRGNRRLKERREEMRRLARQLLIRRTGMEKDLVGSLEGDSDFMINQMMTFLFAGHEATATSISWALYRIARHSEVQKRIREEVTPDLQGNFTSKQILGWSYLSAVYRETLRLHPPAWILARQVLKNDEFGSHVLESGASVLLSIREIHRHPHFWESPEEFVPERFLSERPARHPFAFIPFGAGPRICSGAQLAQVESLLILARILERYSVRLVSSTVETEEMITARPRDGIRVGLERIH